MILSAFVEILQWFSNYSKKITLYLFNKLY